MLKDFFKEIEVFVGINTTGEGFNKQAKISNMLQLLQYELNPAIQTNPDVMDTINDIKQMLGLKTSKQLKAGSSIENKTGQMNTNNLSQKGNLSQKEDSLQKETLNATSGML